MTTYNKPTGSAGTLRQIITYTQNVSARTVDFHVEFWILCSDGATTVGSLPWSGTVAGTNVSGSVGLPAGFGSKKVAEYNVTRAVQSDGYLSTVNSRFVFAIGDSGTSGLGGPTSFTQDVAVPKIEWPAPATPATPSMSSPFAGRVVASWSKPAGRVTYYRLWYWVNGVWAALNTSDLSYTFDVAPGDTVAVQVFAGNEDNLSAGSGTGTITAKENPASTPTGLAVARVSDTQHTLSWTRTSTYTSVVIQRSTNGGAWQQVGVASGNAATYTDTTTVANRKYQYRVAGVSAGGQSGWSNTVTVYTTPAASTGVSAARSGSDIVVSASGVPPYATSFDVRDGATVVGTGVALPFTHVAPDPATPHSYTVRGKVGSLVGAYSAASNTVQLVAPPNAPTNLSPNGAVAASDQDVVFTWVHNPVDSSPQSAFELQYRVDAGAWTTISGTTASSATATVPVGAVEWQVRTKGAHATFSPWSAIATLTVVDRPGVAVVQPADTWGASILPVEWTWYQAQGRPQSAWALELVNSDGLVVESRSESGAATSFTVGTKLTEGSWTVRVQAATGDVWSPWGEQAFTVAFVPPTVPGISGDWDDAQGGVTLTVTFGQDAGTDPTVTFTVERSVDGGDTWEPVLAGAVDGDVSLVDWEAPSSGDTTYRATAYTVEAAAAATVIVVNADSIAVWLSGGPGFGVTGRLPFDPAVKITPGRQRALKQYAGRSLPVALAGEAISRIVAVSGTTFDEALADQATANVAQLTRLAQLEEPLFLFRDPDGRRIYGSIDPIDMDRNGVASRNGMWGYAFTLTEADRSST